MRWSVSKSDEYCSDGNTSALLLCGAVRSCPVSNEFVVSSDTSSVNILMLPETPDVFCVAEHNPTAFSGVHRKMPANAEHHADEYMLQEAVLDGLYGNKFVPAEDEFPTGQTRRMKLSDHFLRAGLYICESVFFRLKSWVVAFFPRFDSSESDLFLVQNTAKRLKTDRRNNFFFNQIFSKFFKRPAFERTIQKVGRTFCSFSDKSFIIFRKFRGTSRLRFRFQRFKTAVIKFFDDSSDVMFGVMNQLCDCRHFIALIGSKYHLSTPDFNTACAATQYSLNLLTFTDSKVSGIQTHKKSLSNEYFLRVCLYNTILCIAQVLNMKNVKIIF